MDIISIYFIALSLLSVFVFYLIKNKYRIIFLTLLSCAFIASFSLNLLVYVIAYSLVNYFIGLMMPGSEYKKCLFRTGLILNLTQLIILKYADFTLSPLFNLVNADPDFILQISKIIIPLGVSFFTLQGIGYLFNIKLGWEKPEKNLIRFILYIVFYPKFLSGPIERSNHFLPQLQVSQNFNENVTIGLRLILSGLFRKVIIANHLSAFVNHGYAGVETVGGLNCILVILIQPLYLYFDFSGYTNIALGFAKMYGIDLLPNFNRPFLSENMTNFWRRFHISLSAWFNDYVFKQTSFRLRKMKSYATVIALFVTWVLFGIWHGAGWNFMILGFLQAFAIYYEFKTKKWRNQIFSKLHDGARKWTGRFFTYCFYGFSLIFFFSPDIPTTLKFIANLKDACKITLNSFLFEPLVFGLFFATIFLIIEVIKEDKEGLFIKIQDFWTQNRFIRLLVYYLAIFLIITQLSGESSFVYEMF